MSLENLPKGDEGSDGRFDSVENWISVVLSEFTTLLGGNAFKSKEYSENGLPILRMGNITKDFKINWNKKSQPYMDSDRELEFKKYVLEGGELLVCLTDMSATGDYLGTVAINNRKALLNQRVSKFVFNENLIKKKWLYYVLQSPKARGYLVSNDAGSIQKNTSHAHVLGADVPLPPLAEQKVIAEKLDILLAQVDNIKTRLDAIPNVIKRFRQSVLSAAVSGKLTEEWRCGAPVEQWAEIKFSELLTDLRSGSGDKPNDDISGVPILRSSAVRTMSIDYSDIKYLDPDGNYNEKNYLIKNDLIFTRLSGSAEYVGNCVLIGDTDKRYQYPDRLFCARLKSPENSRYLECFFASSVFRNHIHGALKSSAGHQRITLGVIKSAMVFLPPLQEQTEIVNRVEKLFAFADQIEKQVSNAQQRVNNLTQSVLAKAFRGELTAGWREQNPELISGENSAEALLEKIKLEREKLKPAKKTRKKK